jgi:hypothetical protein
MGKYEISGMDSVRKTEHPDYKENLDRANKFVQNTEKSLLRGMSVKVCDSQHLTKALITIAWTPPKEAPKGRCATSISLHQSSGDVKNQIEGIFNAYMRTVGDFEKKNPRQTELMDTRLKV